MASFSPLHEYNWPLYELVADLCENAGLKPPATSVFGLHEIADEEAAFQLVEQVSTLAGEPKVAVAGGVERLLQNLDDYRSWRPLDRSGTTDVVTRLANIHVRFRHEELQAHLLDPVRADGLLVELLGPVWRMRDVPHGREAAEAVVLELVSDPEISDRLLAKVIKARDRPKKRYFISRLKNLARAPTARKLRGLIRKVGHSDGHDFEVVFRALKFGARRSLGFPLRPRWLSSLSADDEKLGVAAQAGYELLVFGWETPELKTTRKRDPRGRNEDEVLARYGRTVGDIYFGLRGQHITYTRATPASRSDAPEYSGEGLDFMLSSLRLIDRGATADRARNQIDKIRSFQKSS